MANLNKVRIQLLDENTGAVLEDVDVLTSAEAVTFEDGKKLSEVIPEVTTQLAQKAEKSEINTLAYGKADKTYVDQQISSLGELKVSGVYTTLVDLQTTLPTGGTGVYIITTDGKWYFWNGTAWTSGGIFQSTQWLNALTTQNSTWEVI